jgi:chromosome segregation ATPase
VELEDMLRKAESELTRVREINADLERKAAAAAADATGSAGEVGNAGEILELKHELGREKERGRSATMLAEQIVEGAGGVFEELAEVIRDVCEERKEAEKEVKKAQAEVESMAESMNALKDELKVRDSEVDEKNSVLQTLQAAFDRQVTGGLSLKSRIGPQDSFDTTVPNRETRIILISWHSLAHEGRVINHRPQILCHGIAGLPDARDPKSETLN